MFTKLSKNSSMRVIVRFYNVSISVHMNINMLRLLIYQKMTYINQWFSYNI